MFILVYETVMIVYLLKKHLLLRCWCCWNEYLPPDMGSLLMKYEIEENTALLAGLDLGAEGRNTLGILGMENP